MLDERLVELRNEAGLTQQELADKIHISRGTYAQYEIGRRTPDYDTLQTIADFFVVTVDYLLGRTNIRNPEAASATIESAIADDLELLEFWKDLTKRDDLQLMFKQVRTLSPAAIKRIVKYIKMVEDEEAQEDY